MFLDDIGRIVSLHGGTPSIIGGHWLYCGYGSSHGRLFSFDGTAWYKFDVDEPVRVGKNEINMRPCSVWEMLCTKELLDDVEFVYRLHRFIRITELVDSITDKNHILEGLLK